MSSVDWSAFVYINGRLQSTTNPYFRDPLYGSFTVCLGRQRVFVCGHKYQPYLFVGRSRVELHPYRTNHSYLGNDADDRDEQHYEIILAVNGRRYFIEILQFDGNMLDLKLVEPDGVLWTARCGYQFGVDYPDTDQSRMYEHAPWNEYGVTLPWNDDVLSLDV